MKNIYTSPKGKFVGFLKVLLMALVLVGCGVKGWGQTNPTAFDLSTGNWTLTGWNSTVPTGSYPGNGATGVNNSTGVVATAGNGNMMFWKHGTGDPLIATGSSANYTGSYTVNTAKIYGNGLNGIAFDNTGGIGIGSAVLGINTLNRINIQIGWTGRTIATGARTYGIRLMYRVGTSGSFVDANATATNIFYPANGTAGTSSIMPTITLPAAAEGQSVVQVIWFYYNEATVTSGVRPSLGLDEINVTSTLSNAAPTASSVSIAGTTTVGQTLTGSYTYADTESDPEGISTFKWYRADDAAGSNEVAIGGATATTYTLVAADLNKFIRFSVIPIATSGTLSGVETFSARVGLVCITPTLSSASQAATVICGSGTAVINMGGLVANSLGNRIDYTINSVPQTQITGVNADASGNASFTTSSLTTANNGQTLQITGISHGACNTAFTQNVTLAVATIPTASVAPTVTGTNPSCGATSLNIIVPAGGETYYWQGTVSSGTSIGSPTSSTYPVSATGTYYVRSQNNTSLCWSAASSLLVTINIQPGTPPTPASVSIGAGSNTSFTATTANAVSYIWEVDNGGGYTTIANGGIYSNATSATINLTNVPLANNGYLYRATAVGSSPCVNSAASSPATLTVTPTSSTTDYFRSNSGNTGTGGSWATVTNWQSSPDNATWMTATLAPTSAANAITIRNGHNIDISSGTQTADELTIDASALLRFSGGTFTLANGAGTDLTVNGTFTRTTSNTFTQTGTITFNASSIYNHACNGGNIPVSSWNITSICNITGMTSTEPTSGFGQAFGIFNWNCAGQTTFSIIGAAGAFNPKGLMTVSNTGSSVIELESGGGGSTYNLDGGLTINGGTFVANYDNSGATLEVVLNITGNLIINGNGVFDILQGNGNVTASGYGASVNLTGDITIGSSASYCVTATGNINYGRINFTGSLVQNYYRTSSLASQYVDFGIPVGKSLFLQNSMQLFSSSTTVYDQIFVDGTLNTSTNAIIQSAGTNARFSVFSTGTIITSNTGGLVSAINVGGTKTYTTGASYVFNGATTTPFPTGTFGSPGNLTFNAIVVSNRTSSMTVSSAVNINANAGYTLNATTNNLTLAGAMTIASTGFFDNGGENQILLSGSPSIVVNGTFKTRDAQGFYGTNTSVPSVPITFNSGSTIEFSGASQAYQDMVAGQITGLPTNIIFSGSGTKTGGNISTLNPGLVTIKTGIIVDATGGAAFGGTGTALTMEATSKLSVLGSSTQPTMSGTYTLDPSSKIDFGGSSATLIRLSPTYANIDISGSNVGLSGATSVLNMQAAATFTITSTGTFNVKNTNGFSGTATTAINNTNSPTITLVTGSTINYDGAAQTITNTQAYQNITLSGSGSKTAPATNLLINGNFSRAGTCSFDPNASRVVFQGTAAQTFSDVTGLAPIDFYNVSNTNTINVIVNSAFGILNELNLTSSAKLNLNTGDIHMRSSSTRTAYITDLGTNTTYTNITYGTGRFSIERYLRAFKSWRFLATPIIGGAGTATINESWREAGTTLTANGYGTRVTGPGTIAFPGGVDEYTLRGSMKSYSMALNNYVEVTSADLAANKTIANDEGYYVFVRGDRGVNVAGAAGTTNLRIRGQIRMGNQTFSVNAGAFQSVGNPFASQIDFSNVSNASIAEAFTIWNPSSAGSYNVGAFETYVKDLNPPYDFKLNGTGAVLNKIESGQAFFIQSSSAGSITIKESDKTTGSALVSRENEQGRPGVTIPTLEINLHTNDINGVDYIADAAMINFNNSYSSDLDNLDVKKITNAVDNLVIKYGTINLVAERRPNLIVTDTIRLGLTSTRIAPYRFEIDPSVLGNLQLAAFLKDKFLQTETPVSLTAVTNYNFNITADAGSRVADRFMIVFRQPVAGPLPVRFIDIAATKNTDKTNAVKWTVANDINMQQYEIERSDKGTNFVSIGNTMPNNNNGGNYTYNFVDAAPLALDNFYRIKAISANGQIQYSAIVKIVADVKEPFIAVSPNPVENKTMQLQMGNQAKGLYSVQLINNAGQTVYRGSITVNNYMQTNSIELDRNTATGNYQLLIVSANGDKTAKQIMVQ